jgi:hypothetical protein
MKLSEAATSGVQRRWLRPSANERASRRNKRRRTGRSSNMGCFYFQSNAFWMALTFLISHHDRFSHQMEAAFASCHTESCPWATSGKGLAAFLESGKTYPDVPQWHLQNRLASN